jgi:signal transduction histidine kinase
VNPKASDLKATLERKKQQLDRRTWLLWSTTFAVVLALAVAVPLLYLPVVQVAAGVEDSLAPGHAYMALVGLGGLVLIFCLYTALKQVELNHMREALAREEQDKQDVRTRLSELSALFNVSTALNLQLRLDVILEIIVRRVVSTLKAQQASVMLYNAGSGLLETQASYGLESEFARNARTKLGEGIAGWVAQRQEAVLLSNEHGHPLAQHYKANRNITSALSLPLRVGERCVGVLNVNRINHPEPFRDHHRDMLQMFAEHVGSVIERAEAIERLSVRTRELEAANLRLAEMNQLKDVFLSTASHELKTPLSTVIAYAELLEENDADLTREQRGEFLRRLHGEAGRLLGLIEDILDLSRIESGKLSLRRRPMSLAEVARSGLETSQSVAKKHGVDLVITVLDELPVLPLDEVKMRQVVTNLIGNAVKFSPEHGRVEVRVRADGADAVLEVADRGPGIQPEETTHIFELFGQGAVGRKPASGGLGIGLHLVKRLTELHGGHVGVNSRPGEGSVFWVRLPMALAESTLPAEELSEAA